MEWKEVRLGDLVDRKIGYGIVQPGESLSDGVPVIKVNNIISGLTDVSLLEKTAVHIAEKYPRTKLNGGELVISLVGSVGKTAIVPKCFAGANLVRATGLIDIKDSYLCRWVKYYIDSIKGQSYINSNLNTTVQATLNVKSLVEMPIPLPELKVLRNTVDILSSLDAKIENNNKINAKLEEIAQALFKSWFIDFEPFKVGRDGSRPAFGSGNFVESELGMIPEGWTVVTLDDMTSKFGTGLNPRKNFVLGEGSNYYVTIKNMGNNRVYLDDKCDKVTDEAIEKINKRSKLAKGDLLFSGIGTIGRVALVTETPTNWNTSESVYNLHPIDGISSEFIYLLLLSDIFQNYVKIHAQGGVQQGIRMASLKAFQMAIPSTDILKRFDALIIPLISKAKELDKENDNLAQTRDTLLPKLISGEIEL